MILSVRLVVLAVALSLSAGPTLAQLRETTAERRIVLPSDFVAIDRDPGLFAHDRRIFELFETDPQAAYDAAWGTAELAAKAERREGWSRYAGLALYYAHRAGLWDAIERDVWPVREELVAEPHDAYAQKNLLRLMDHAAERRLHDAHADLAVRYVASVAASEGKNSSAHVQARIVQGASHLRIGENERGAEIIEAALRTIAAGDDVVWTLFLHMTAAETLWRRGLIREADRVYVAGLETGAARKPSLDAARLWLERSRFLQVHDRFAEAFVAAATTSAMTRALYSEDNPFATEVREHIATLCAALPRRDAEIANADEVCRSATGE